MPLQQHTSFDLFINGQEGYHTFRIPALLVASKSVLLAFAEGRKQGRGDAGDIDLVLKRSFDHGHTWQPLQIVVSETGMTCGNPCPVLDRTTGTVWLPFCKNLADGDEQLIVQGKAPRTVWLTYSNDEGATWATPHEITTSVKDPAWTWYATGPTHGIQLASGRLLIPCDHVMGTHSVMGSDSAPQSERNFSHVIYSDDHGATWHIGGGVIPGTDECAVVETVNGAVYINCRNYSGSNRRVVAWSDDQGATFTQVRQETTLIEPVCQGSLVRVSSQTQPAKNYILFANPASTRRERMTVRLSEDEGQSWPVAKQLCAGPSAYSDVAVAADGAICCLYERGEQHPYECLTLARFNVAWLLDGQEEST